MATKKCAEFHRANVVFLNSKPYEMASINFDRIELSFFQKQMGFVELISSSFEHHLVLHGLNLSRCNC